ncbi:RING finger protein B-like [Lucilia cuprina]|uniref:RING finger protein B-like n=1 Tax=Lucilia cuprina TaxID=7375 RepID=UPI001F06EFB6|nr:RING finger protein B-like [Lucilia cuprina]
MLNLPLISPDHIQEMFLNLKKDLLSMSKSKQDCLNIFLKYFEKEWMKKITPSVFSVHLEVIRTTSALEGFNSKLSKKLEKHGRFLKFLEVIRNEDFTHLVSLIQSSAGILSVLPKKRKQNLDKDSKIWELSQKLNRGIISLTDFFNIVINKENNIIECDKMVEENVEDDSESEDIEEINIHEITEVLRCVICVTEARNILLTPCRHFNICSNCFDHLDMKSKNNNSPSLCSYCRQIVQNNLKIFQ